MIPEIQIRNADNSDIEFIIETIIQAEKGTGNLISYCKLFNISEPELRSVLQNILEQRIDNFEFSLNSFKVACSNITPVAAYGAWVEAADGIASGILKISALRSFLKKESFVYYKSAIPFIDDLSIKRQPGTIQFESVYIKDEFRGKNIFNMLVQALLDESMLKNPEVEVAHVQVLKQNNVSLLVHQKSGFRIIEERTSSNPHIFDYYSGDTRVLMEKKLK